MAESGLRAEIEILRREIAALRSERSPPDNSDAGGSKAQFSFGSGATDLTAKFQVLADEISTFIEDPEQGIADHPLASVLGAFVVGVLVGRVLNR